MSDVFQSHESHLQGCGVAAACQQEHLRCGPVVILAFSDFAHVGINLRTVALHRADHESGLGVEGCFQVSRQTLSLGILPSCGFRKEGFPLLTVLLEAPHERLRFSLDAP